MSPCAKFNKFQLTFSYRITVVYIYSDMKILQDQRHQGSKIKGRERPENGVTSATLLSTLNE